MPLAWPAVAVAIALLTAAPARAAERVDFVVGPNAPALEVDAANESAAQFQRLFGVETAVAKQIPAGAAQLVLIGSPATNPAVKEALGDRWPKVSDQGIVIRSVERNGKPALVLGGGSPAATFWAACEFGYRHGIRYLLHEDIFPAAAVPLKLEGHDVTMEPALRTRAWRTVDGFATAWSAADQKKIFRQLAKLKFNCLVLLVHAWQPFVHYDFKGVKKQTALLWYGEKLRVDGDTPGKVVFNGAQFFENPDFAGKKTYEEMTEAGVRHLRALIDAAHELGMSVELVIAPLEFPREFAQVVPGSADTGPDSKLPSFDPRIPAPETPEEETLRELVRTVLRAHLTTYPNIDAVCLELRRSVPWGESNDFMRKLFASQGRRKKWREFENAVLKFLGPVLADESSLKRPDGRYVDFTIGELGAENIGQLTSVFPAGVSVLTSVNEPPDAMARTLKTLVDAHLDKVKCRLDLSLTNVSAGVLPQSSTRRIEAIIAELVKNKWDGFAARHWAPGELDPVVHYLSRVSFDPKITARQAHDELFVAITGNAAVADRLWRAFGHIEQATDLIDKNGFGFASPIAEMMTNHFVAKPAPSWWKDATAHYTEASNEFYRSHDAADPRSRRLLFYYAKRSEYVLEYLAAVGAVRAAAVAKKDGKTDEVKKQLETAVEQMYNALDTLSDVARDQSDRGLIAVLAQYAYRPLVQKAESAANDGKK